MARIMICILIKCKESFLSYIKWLLYNITNFLSKASRSKICLTINVSIENILIQQFWSKRVWLKTYSIHSSFRKYYDWNMLESFTFLFCSLLPTVSFYFEWDPSTNIFSYSFFFLPRLNMSQCDIYVVCLFFFVFILHFLTCIMYQNNLNFFNQCVHSNLFKDHVCTL